MSRNGSGVYSLPAGNPVVTGTTISSSWANTTLSDIATALTGSVAADGQTAMTGNLQMGNNKVTGLAVATASGDALSYGQAATISALTVSGAFAANGGATLGDASGDALTINSSAVSIPNGLNFDSNTFVIDATNNRVGVGTSSPTTSLTIASGNANISNGQFDVARTTYPVVQLQQTGSTGIGQFAMNGNNLEIRQTQAFDTLFYTNNTERMRIDSSGNVGIGTSSPATKLDVSGNLRFSAANPTIELNNGGPQVYSTSANTLQFATGGGIGSATERMRIDSSGNVGIGTSSPSTKLQVNDTITIGTADKAIQWLNSGTALADIRADSSSNMIFRNTSSYTERMRIDSSGNLLVGQTSAGVVNGIGTSIESSGLDNARITVNHSSGGSSNGSFYMRFAYGGTVAGTISQNSTTSVAYNTSSDYRLKENIAPMTGALDKVALLKPVTYNWKADGSAGQGFIAHELQEVVPDCVTGEKDAVETYIDEEGVEQTRPVYQGIDTSFLVATLTAAIQELKAEFDEYKATHP